MTTPTATATRRARHGMTLVELLVVLLVLSVLGGIAMVRYRGLVDRAEAAVLAEHAHLAQVAAVELELLPPDSLPADGLYDESQVAADPVLAAHVPARVLRGPRRMRVRLVVARDSSGEPGRAVTLGLRYDAPAGDARAQGILRMLAGYTGDRYAVSDDGSARFDFARPAPRPPAPPSAPASGGDPDIPADSGAPCPPAGAVPAPQLPPRCRTP